MSSEVVETESMEADEGFFNNLVSQFANALDCFRELVQNSIDAGSPTIDVWTEYEPGEGHRGTIAFHVDDYGEGMDKSIIDHQLTKLFASDKEGDLTKIGKFGIGFVSVFALKPEAVLLHTGRGGEYWEVLFHADRSYEKSALDMPVEGTQITIFLNGDLNEYRRYVDGIRKTLKRWCMHAESEVTFEDRTPPPGTHAELEVINEPFEVQGDLMRSFDLEDRSQVVMAWTDEPVYGFYNRGLTLAYTRVGEQVLSGSRATALKSISMKIRSRYLEHTLSRDTVLRDENYLKAMNDIDRAWEELVEQLVVELERLVARPEWTVSDMDRYSRLVGYLPHSLFTEVVADGMESPGERLNMVQRRIFRGHHGQGYSAEDLLQAFRRDGALLACLEPSELTEHLAGQGIPVVVADVTGIQPSSFALDFQPPLVRLQTTIGLAVDAANRAGVWRTLIARFWKGSIQAAVVMQVRAPESVYFPVRINVAPDAALQELLAGASQILERVGLRYARITTFRPLTSEAPHFVIARELAEFMRSSDAVSPHGSFEVAVNETSTHLAAALELWPTQPGLAAYCVARSILLRHMETVDVATALIAAAQDWEASRTKA